MRTFLGTSHFCLHLRLLRQAFSETLSIIQQLTPYNVELGAIDDAQTNNPFVQGRCALQIKNILPFKVGSELHWQRYTSSCKLITAAPRTAVHRPRS